MHYSLKSKCQGCAALVSGAEFSCSFGLPLITESALGGQTQPQPSHVKCYKPKTARELNEAARLMDYKTIIK